MGRQRRTGGALRATPPRVTRALMLAATLGYLALLLVWSPAVSDVVRLPYDPALDLALHGGAMGLAAVCCALRAVRHAAERLAWVLLSAAVLVYGAGDLYYYRALARLPLDQVPYPSWADAGWIAWYPLLLAGLIALVRARLTGVRAVLWLDGLTAGVGAAAVAGALLLAPLLEVSGGEPLIVLVGLAYPVADLALLTIVVVVLHLNGWRPDVTWSWVAVAAALLMAGDTLYLLQLAKGSYVEGTLLDASWTLVCVCLGMAAGSRMPTVREVPTARVAVAIPGVLSLAGTSVLFLGATHARHLPLVVSLLGVLSVLLASTRLLVTIRETQRLAEARREARTDDLTGLPNRRELHDRLSQVLLLGKRRSTISAVLLVDLDRFKEVNDTLGHHHGDQLLRAVAARLAATFREYDTVARLGGDEFAVLLPEVADEASAVALARRCVDVLEDDFVVEGVTLHVEASIGLALAPRHGQDPNALLRAADVAMYEAKAGNREVAVYDPASDGHTPTRLALLGDLRRALQGDEVVVHYQPKVGVHSLVVGGVEALVRWNHPVRGLLTPGDFVPAAESTGLIMPLTVRTLELALADARTWMDRGHPVQVAVNLSPRCLLEPDLPGLVQGLLDRHGVPAGLLRLEITESSLMVDPARALGVLSALQGLGTYLSIDDFGTGYSSLSYLQRMPVDELKIDRSFVVDMLTGAGDTVLVRSSIELGHNLGLSVVAEGVEDEATFSLLRRLGCDVAQGFHLAPPMAADAMTAWIGARASARGAVIGTVAGTARASTVRSVPSPAAATLG